MQRLCAAPLWVKGRSIKVSYIYIYINFWNFHTIHVFEVRESKHSFLDKNALNLEAVARKSRDGHTTNALLSILLSCHVMSRHVTSCHVTSCHVMSCHVESRGTVTRPTALLSTDFTHTQLDQIRHEPCLLVVPNGADTIPHQRYILLCG